MRNNTSSVASKLGFPSLDGGALKSSATEPSMLLYINLTDHMQAKRDLKDIYDEGYELGLGDCVKNSGLPAMGGYAVVLVLLNRRSAYFRELFRLSHEPVKLQI